MTRPPIALGTSDFRKLRMRGSFFADKSSGIMELIDSGDEVILVPRPRRFGKTLFLNMCREFFDMRAQDSKQLFEGLTIQDSPHWEKHFGKYPVMMMTFKDVKALDWESCRRDLFGEIDALFAHHLPTIEHLDFDVRERPIFDRLVSQRANVNDYRIVPNLLSKWLHQSTGQPVIILIDEYDTPIHAAWDQGYYPQIIDFMRAFLSSACKDNSYLFKAMITGILRVAKESIFSGMNNLGVYSIDDQTMHSSFGFTEDEVKTLLDARELSDHLEDVRKWYNGYRFGPDRTTIYNPWSVLNYADKPKDGLKPYWVNTAKNELIEKLITKQGQGLREELDNLIHNKPILKNIEECVSMRDIEARPELAWSLLYHSGYLRCDQTLPGIKREVRTPNEEVRQIYLGMIERWFSMHMPKGDRPIEEMARSLGAGDTHLFERTFSKVLKEVMSYHDFSHDPEAVYHAMSLGMLIWLTPWFQIRSNRESGYGRYDLALYPKDPKKQGYVIEFKRADADLNETLEDMAQKAMEQMTVKDYTSDIQAQGCSGVTLIAIAFQGKEHLMQIEEK